MKCPLRTSKDWRLLVSQVGEDLAWRTYVTYDNDYPPSLMSTTDLRKHLGIPYKGFENNLPKYYGLLKKFNEVNKTSHTIKSKRIGESQQVEIELIPNYLPKGHVVKLSDSSSNKRIKETYKNLSQLDLFEQIPTQVVNEEVVQLNMEEHENLERLGLSLDEFYNLETEEQRKIKECYL